MAEPTLRRCDVAVIGSGPAGIAAACAVAEAGRDVLLLDESPRPGGQIWRHTASSPPLSARKWLRRLERSSASLESGAAVVDAEGRTDEGVPRFRLTVEQEGRGWTVDAGALVLATGARELFLPFPGWTLPNVYGVGGAQALLKSGMSFAGKRVVVAGSGPLLLPVAAALTAAGARVALIAEQASLRNVSAFAAGLWRQPRKLLEAIRYRRGTLRSAYRTDSWVVLARGEGRLEQVDVMVRGRRRSLDCDVLCSGFGLVPNLSLPRLLGCALEDGFESPPGGRFGAHQRNVPVRPASADTNRKVSRAINLISQLLKPINKTLLRL